MTLSLMMTMIGSSIQSKLCDVMIYTYMHIRMFGMYRQSTF